MKVAAQADLKSPLGKQDLAVSARAFQVPALVGLPPNVAKNYRILVVDISIGLRLGICWPAIGRSKSACMRQIAKAPRPHIFATYYSL